MKYRKKPIVIDAIRWTGGDDSTSEVQAFVGRMENMDGDVSGERFYPATLTYDDEDGQPGHERVWPNDYPAGGRLWVEANTTWVPIDPGEWVIQDSRGAYPCKPDIFDATYEPA